MSNYTVYSNNEYKERAVRLARGRYQAALLTNREAWSGATLRGTAKKYSGRYAISRNNLVKRLENAGIPVEFKRGMYNKKILFVGFKNEKR